MQIKRRFPRTDITYSRKQMLEFNILIMQALFPEAFTEKERKILVELCQNLGPGEAITKTGIQIPQSPSINHKPAGILKLTFQHSPVHFC